MEIDDEVGAYLVRTARGTVEKFLDEGQLSSIPKEYPPILHTAAGVFVTINKIFDNKKELRGCIGFPYTDGPLIENTIKAALSSARNDPRFPPLSKDELDSLLFGVSVLTPPELITVNSPRELPQRIKLGRDGLIVVWSFASGLLLPQVPLEYGWNQEQFLENACMKAGATPDIWLVPTTKIYKFQAIVFEEREPRGQIARKGLA